jgi:nicotinamidase-related amidase
MTWAQTTVSQKRQNAMQELTNRSNQIHGLLTPDNCALILIDHQPQMAFGVQSIDRQLLLNNVVGLAKAAKVFELPTVLTTVAAKTFSGELFPEVQAVFPDQQPIDRHNINAWDDPSFRDAVQHAGRPKLVVAALWTEVCLAMPVIDMLRENYEVYVVADACGGTSWEAHERAMQRCVQAGAVPMTWLAVLLELQRDWARVETYDATLNVAVEHAGAYGIGIRYVKSMQDEHGSETERRLSDGDLDEVADAGTC